MSKENKKVNTTKLVITALMICLILVATIALRIPSPTQGYIHLGDTIVFLSVLLLGKKYAAFAAAVGSALADLLGGFAIYAPWTLVIKFLMAFVMGLFIEISLKKKSNRIIFGGITLSEIIGMILSGLIMIVGYVIVDGTIAGNMWTGILGIPLNLIQFAAGLFLALALAAALYKTPARKLFVYRLYEVASKEEKEEK